VNGGQPLSLGRSASLGDKITASSTPKIARQRVDEAYHVDLRMNVARRLLRETKNSVVDVALDVGYANRSHFAKPFRRETGLSLSDYRRQR